MQPEPITAYILADQPDRFAPVSGSRCRACGANARTRHPDERWTIYLLAAYCPKCTDALKIDPT